MRTIVEVQLSFLALHVNSQSSCPNSNSTDSRVYKKTQFNQRHVSCEFTLIQWNVETLLALSLYFQIKLSNLFPHKNLSKMLFKSSIYYIYKEKQLLDLTTVSTTTYNTKKWNSDIKKELIHLAIFWQIHINITKKKFYMYLKKKKNSTKKAIYFFLKHFFLSFVYFKDSINSLISVTCKQKGKEPSKKIFWEHHNIISIRLSITFTNSICYTRKQKHYAKSIQAIAFS